MNRLRLCVFMQAAILLSVAGCGVDNERLVAFLHEPRVPVTGTEDYRVLPPDVITIESVNVTEIDGVSRRVGPDGRITVPLLKSLPVAGKTTAQIEQEIVTAAGKYYDRVDATVHVSQYSSQKFYMFGQVGRPGPMPWTGSDTLLDALARSQPTSLAWPERIKVIRAKGPTRGGYKVAEGQEKKELRQQYASAGKSKTGANELRIDLMKMVKTGDLSHNVLLQPDDVVYVPPNPFAAVGLALRTILYPVSPVLETLRVPNALEDSIDDDQNDNNN